MLLENPISGQQTNIKEIEGKLYWGNLELKEITEDQRKLTKTGANYYCENDKSINDNNFFIHLNKEDKTFYLAETFNTDSHTVWLKDKQSITFHKNDNIVFRNDVVNKSFPHQKEEDANRLIKYQYETLKKEKEFILFNDPLKDSDSDKIYLEKINNKWFRLTEELTPITEEQKKLSKTKSNYSLVNSAGTFFFHLDDKNNKITLSETINDNAHTVWLKDKGRITYFKGHTVVTEQAEMSTNSSHYDGHPDLTEIMKKSYSEFSTYQPVINNTNADKPFSEEIKNKQNIIMKENEPILKNDNEENVGYLKGLRKELKQASETSATLMMAYGLKDMVTKGAGLKKHKFLKLGTAAGVVAVVAASPIAGAAAAAVIATGTLVTLGAAFNATVITGMHTMDYIEDKIKNALGKNNKIDPQAKNMFDVKSSISTIRSQLLDNQKLNNEHKIK